MLGIGGLKAKDWGVGCVKGGGWGLAVQRLKLGTGGFNLVPFFLFFSCSPNHLFVAFCSLGFLDRLFPCFLVPCVFPLKPKLVTWQHMFQN